MASPGYLDDDGNWHDPYDDAPGRFPAPDAPGGYTVPGPAPAPSPDPNPTPDPEVPLPGLPPPEPRPTPRSTLTGLSPWTGQFNPGNYGKFTLPDLPPFRPPTLPTIDPFKAPVMPEIAPFQKPAAFAKPTADAVYDDPSFELRKGVGEQALVNSQAAQGVLRSGGSLKDLVDYNQNFASTEYKDIYSRAADEYDRAYRQLLDEFTVNRDTTMGTYDRTYRSALDEAAKEREAKFGLYDRDLNAAGIGYGGELEQYRTKAQAVQRNAELEWQRAYQEYEQTWREWKANQDELMWTYDYEKSLV